MLSLHKPIRLQHLPTRIAKNKSRNKDREHIKLHPCFLRRTVIIVCKTSVILQSYTPGYALAYKERPSVNQNTYIFRLAHMCDIWCIFFFFEGFRVTKVTQSESSISANYAVAADAIEGNSFGIFSNMVYSKEWKLLNMRLELTHAKGAMSSRGGV